MKSEKCKHVEYTTTLNFEVFPPNKRTGMPSRCEAYIGLFLHETKLILHSHAPYLLLDEPFNGISPLTPGDIRKYIAESAQTHGIIMVDHNYREVHKIANRLMYIDDCYLREINDKRELMQYGYF